MKTKKQLVVFDARQGQFWDTVFNSLDEALAAIDSEVDRWETDEIMDIAFEIYKLTPCKNVEYIPDWHAKVTDLEE